MEINFQEAFGRIETVVGSQVDAQAGMEMLIGYCASRLPDPTWDVIRRLGIRDDIGALRTWLTSVATKEPAPEQINAYWFGLFNPVDEKGNTTCGSYVAGSDHFDPHDETGDWACAPAYFPGRRYADSAVLRGIYEAAYLQESGPGDFAEYVLCLGYAGLAIKDVCMTADPGLLLGGSRQRVVAVGFDSGDFMLLGRIRPDGFVLNRASVTG
jgi:hypothetical protein